MAKPVFSSGLKNLKFMQRAAQKEEMMLKKEEVKPEGNFTSHGSVTRKCVVIMEGDPHPGAVKGRMSFQSFNPSIDKLNQEASQCPQPLATATSPGTERAKESFRENEESMDQGECSNVENAKQMDNGEHKRKQSEVASESQYPNKSPKSEHGDQQSPASKRKGGFKKPTGDKFDWNLLRRSKSSEGKKR